jgi:hypothetical protein
MCDYSLHSVKSRPAQVGDKLTTHNFNTGTRGFAAPEDASTAVCVLPGTELAFATAVRCGRSQKPQGRVAHVLGVSRGRTPLNPMNIMKDAERRSTRDACWLADAGQTWAWDRLFHSPLPRSSRPTSTLVA